MDLNKITLIGKCTNAIDYSKHEWYDMLKFTLVTNFAYKNHDGWRVQESEYHTCIAYDDAANFLYEHIARWSKLYLEWRLKTSQWTTAQAEKKYSTHVIVSHYIVLDKVDHTQNIDW